MALPTLQDLEDGATDFKVIEDFANGSATLNGNGTVPRRLADPVKTLDKLVQDIASNNIGDSAAAKINQRTNGAWIAVADFAGREVIPLAQRPYGTVVWVEQAKRAYRWTKDEFGAGQDGWHGLYNDAELKNLNIDTTGTLPQSRIDGLSDTFSAVNARIDKAQLAVGTFADRESIPLNKRYYGLTVYVDQGKRTFRWSQNVYPQNQNPDDWVGLATETELLAIAKSGADAGDLTLQNQITYGVAMKIAGMSATALSTSPNPRATVSWDLVGLEPATQELRWGNTVVALDKTARSITTSDWNAPVSAMVIGDSLSDTNDTTTNGGWGAMLANSLGIPYYNVAKYSAGSKQVYRSGAKPLLLTLNGDTLPAGGNSASVTQINGAAPGPQNPASFLFTYAGDTITANNSLSGTIAGRHVTVSVPTAGSSDYSIVADAGSTSVAVPPNSLFVPDFAAQLGISELWIFLSQNYFYQNFEGVYADIDAIVRRGRGQRIMIFGLIPDASWVAGTPEYTAVRAFNAGLKQRWPRYYVEVAGQNTLERLRASGDGSVGDNADRDAGITPRSLRKSGDSLHLNTAGQTVVKQLAVEFRAIQAAPVVTSDTIFSLSIAGTTYGALPIGDIAVAKVRAGNLARLQSDVDSLRVTSSVGGSPFYATRDQGAAAVAPGGTFTSNETGVLLRYTRTNVAPFYDAGVPAFSAADVGLSSFNGLTPSTLPISDAQAVVNQNVSSVISGVKSCLQVATFADIANAKVQPETRSIKTASWLGNGKGGAFYIRDNSVTSSVVTSNPRTCAITSDGVGFRLAGQRLDVHMFGVSADANFSGGTDDTLAITDAFKWCSNLDVPLYGDDAAIRCAVSLTDEKIDMHGIRFFAESGKTALYVRRTPGPRIQSSGILRRQFIGSLDYVGNSGLTMFSKILAPVAGIQAGQIFMLASEDTYTWGQAAYGGTVWNGASFKVHALGIDYDTQAWATGSTYVLNERVKNVGLNYRAAVIGSGASTSAPNHTGTGGVGYPDGYSWEVSKASYSEAETVTGATSGAVGVIASVAPTIVESGGALDATTGRIFFERISGTFVSGEVLIGAGGARRAIVNGPAYIVALDQFKDQKFINNLILYRLPEAKIRGRGIQLAAIGDVMDVNVLADARKPAQIEIAGAVAPDLEYEIVNAWGRGVTYRSCYGGKIKANFDNLPNYALVVKGAYGYAFEAISACAYTDIVINGRNCRHGETDNGNINSRLLPLDGGDPNAAAFPWNVGNVRFSKVHDSIVHDTHAGAFDSHPGSYKKSYDSIKAINAGGFRFLSGAVGLQVRGYDCTVSNAELIGFSNPIVDQAGNAGFPFKNKYKTIEGEFVLVGLHIAGLDNAVAGDVLPEIEINEVNLRGDGQAVNSPAFQAAIAINSSAIVTVRGGRLSRFNGTGILNQGNLTDLKMLGVVFDHSEIGTSTETWRNNSPTAKIFSSHPVIINHPTINSPPSDGRYAGTTDGLDVVLGLPRSTTRRTPAMRNTSTGKARLTRPQTGGLTYYDAGNPIEGSSYLLSDQFEVTYPIAKAPTQIWSNTETLTINTERTSGLYTYRVTGVPGTAGPSTVRPAHATGSATGSDGYTWLNTGGFSDGYTGVRCLSSGVYAAIPYIIGETISVNAYRSNAGNAYRVVAIGSGASTRPPTHVSGTSPYSDGYSWIYLGSAATFGKYGLLVL